MQTGKFQIVCAQIIRIVAILVLGYLTILSVFTTAIEGPYSYTNENGVEQTENLVRYMDDKSKWIILFCLIAVGIYYLCVKKIKVKNEKPFIYALGGIYIVIAGAYLLSSRFAQLSDAIKLQMSVIEAAGGDYHSFELGNYMYRYPFQAGYFLYESFFYRLFGEAGFLIMQLINLVYLVLAYVMILKIVKYAWKNIQPIIIDIIALLFALFLPLLLYTTTLYGIIPSLLFSLIGYYNVILFVDDYKWKNVIIAAISLSIAYQFKGNALIYITTVCIYIIPFVFDRKKRILFAIPIILVAYLLGNQFTALNTYALTGQKLSEGCPVTGVILMGISEAPIAPGGYNGRNTEIMEECGWDYDAAKDKGIEELKNRIGKLIDNPVYALDFFNRKYAAQWNDPLFQCIQIVERQYNKENKIYEFFISGAGRSVIDAFLNLMHSWVLVGCMIYLMFIKEKYDMKDMSLMLAFLGGFAFHSFWESKALYAIYYWTLLFPYAAVGYYKISCAFEVKLGHKDKLNSEGET